MAVRENGKLVVFTGSSHSGVLSMVDAVGTMGIWRRVVALT
ncbi:MAG: hypothetical protein ACP5VF_13265 [Acidobacteriota bacterium]